MIKWLQKFRPAKFPGAAELLDSYGAILQHNKSVVIDIGKLPDTKDKLVSIFRLAWIGSPDEPARQSVEGCWVALAMFQEGVGDAEMPMPDPDAAITPEGMDQLGTTLQWMELVRTEMASRRREIESLRAMMPSPRSA